MGKRQEEITPKFYIDYRLLLKINFFDTTFWVKFASYIKISEMKKILFFLSLILLVTISFGQSDTSKQTSKTYYLGVGAAKTMGLGATFRMWGEKYGFNTSFLPVLDKNQNMFISGSLSPMIKLRKTKKMTIYTFNGNHYIYRTDYKEVTHQGIDPYYGYNTTYYDRIKYYRSIFNIGLGVGIEAHVNYVVFGANISYAFIFEYKEQTSIMPGGGIFLLFKL